MIEAGLVFMGTAAVLGVLALASVARIVLGPTAPDRVVGLDTTNTIVMAALVVLGAAFKQAIFIDVAIVYAMLAFVATLYISRSLEGAA